MPAGPSGAERSAVDPYYRALVFFAGANCAQVDSVAAEHPRSGDALKRKISPGIENRLTKKCAAPSNTSARALRLRKGLRAKGSTAIHDRRYASRPLLRMQLQPLEQTSATISCEPPANQVGESERAIALFFACLYVSRSIVSPLGDARACCAHTTSIADSSCSLGRCDQTTDASLVKKKKTTESKA